MEEIQEKEKNEKNEEVEKIERAEKERNRRIEGEIGGGNKKEMRGCGIGRSSTSSSITFPVHSIPLNIHKYVMIQAAASDRNIFQLKLPA